MAANSSRAKPFQETRKHHRLEIAEDYTELISELIATTGVARITDLANRFGVSHVTAVRTVRRLTELGYLSSTNRQPISLTSKGERLARHAALRHDLIVRFLISIGVPRAVAEVDAEGAEHHFSSATLRCIADFLEQPSG